MNRSRHLREPLEVHRRFMAAFGLVVAALGVWGTPAAGAAQITEYELPFRSQPVDITTGPDGNLWFTESGRGRIGRLTPDGQLREFPLPTPGADPRGIAAGGGHLFYTEFLNTKIGRISLDGTVRERSTQTCPPVPCGLRGASDVVVAPDGSPWFSVDIFAPAGTEKDAGYLDICSTTQELAPGPCTTVDRFDFSQAHTSGGPTVGPDGAIWFSDRFESFIGRIPATGDRVLRRYPLPPRSRPTAITTGPDGALWFVDEERGLIGRLTPAGALRFFSLPRSDSRPAGIAAGPDGALWFTESGPNADAIGRITLDGKISEFRIPTPDSRPIGITLGPDGAMWFVENFGNKVGRIEVPAPAAAVAPPGSNPAGPAPSQPPGAPGAKPAQPSGPRSARTPSPATPALVRVRLRPTAYRRGARRLPVLRFRLEAGVGIELRIRRARPGAAVRVNRRRRTGPGSARIALRDARRLAPGRYVVEVVPVAADGARGPSRRARLQIRG